MKKSFFKKENKKEKTDKEEKKQDSAAVLVNKRFTERKVVRFLDKITDRILILICIILLCLGGYALLDTIHIYYHANDSSLLTYKPKVDKDGTVRDPLSLPGAVGWLTLDGSNVDYPIMQGTDNNAYLNKDPYGNYSLSGSLFLDAANSPEFTDQYSMIYGHHMDHNTMFGALDEYLKKDYFDKHRSGSIIIGSKSYKLVLFAALECSAYQNEIFDVRHGGALGYIRENAEIFYPDDVTDYSQILAMSTCQEADSDQRTVIFAVIVGGPGTLNSDGSQKSTTAGDNVVTGTNATGLVYYYWFGLFVAVAVGAVMIIQMKKDKESHYNGNTGNLCFTSADDSILDAVYKTMNKDVSPLAEMPQKLTEEIKHEEKPTDGSTAVPVIYAPMVIEAPVEEQEKSIHKLRNKKTSSITKAASETTSSVVEKDVKPTRKPRKKKVSTEVKPVQDASTSLIEGRVSIRAPHKKKMIVSKDAVSITKSGTKKATTEETKKPVRKPRKKIPAEVETPAVVETAKSVRKPRKKKSSVEVKQVEETAVVVAEKSVTKSAETVNKPRMKKTAAKKPAKPVRKTASSKTDKKASSVKNISAHKPAESPKKQVVKKAAKMPKKTETKPAAKTVKKGKGKTPAKSSEKAKTVVKKTVKTTIKKTGVKPASKAQKSSKK